MFTPFRAALLVLCLAALPALAQPKPTAAQPTPDDRARQWLTLVDDGNYADGVRQLGTGATGGATQLSAAMTLRTEREPLGAMASRDLKDVSLQATLPKLPRGQYAVVRYDSRFARKTAAVETVTLAMNKGAWAVIAYRIE